MLRIYSTPHVRYSSNGENTAEYNTPMGTTNTSSKCRPIIVDHFYARGRSSYRGSEEITSPRKGIMWRMRAILTRARGQTLDSLFSLTGAFPQRGNVRRLAPACQRREAKCWAATI